MRFGTIISFPSFLLTPTAIRTVSESGVQKSINGSREACDRTANFVSPLALNFWAPLLKAPWQIGHVLYTANIRYLLISWTFSHAQYFTVSRVINSSLNYNVYIKHAICTGKHIIDQDGWWIVSWNRVERHTASNVIASNTASNTALSLIEAEEIIKEVRLIY